MSDRFDRHSWHPHGKWSRQKSCVAECAGNVGLNPKSICTQLPAAIRAASCKSLKPQVDFVPIQFRNIGKRITWSEFAAAQQFATRMFDLCNGQRHIFRFFQSEPEVRDATSSPRDRSVAL